MSRVHENVFSMPVKMISFHIGGGNPSSGLKRPLLFFSGRPGAEPSRAGLVRLGGSDFFFAVWPPVRLLTERVVYSKAGLFLQFFFTGSGDGRPCHRDHASGPAAVGSRLDPGARALGLAERSRKRPGAV